MSAFVVSAAHINALVSMAAAHRVSYYFDGARYAIAGREQEIASILLAENERSVNYRYRDEEHNEIRFRPSLKSLPAVAILKLCNCFDYQACETDDYTTTQAAAIIAAIRADAIRHLPGYESAAWTID